MMKTTTKPKLESPDDLVCLLWTGPQMMFVRRSELAGLRPDADLADRIRFLCGGAVDRSRSTPDSRPHD